MKFLRNLLASILGTLLAFGILFVMFFIFTLLIGGSDNGVVVRKNSVLELGFTKPIKDYVGRDEADPFGGLWEEGVGLDVILHAIEEASKDDNIKGISLTTSFLQAGLAQTQEIRKALLDFKLSGKFIFAHSDFFTQKDYYLASVANKVYLNPVGAMDFKGLASEVLYYKDLQEKSGVKMEVIRHGKYKSAVEPYLSNNMSEENRTQIRELISSIWNTMINDISNSRSINQINLNTIADTLGARTPEHALASGLVDDLLFHDEYEEVLKIELGLEEDDKPNYVNFFDYMDKVRNRNLKSGQDKIAVIYAQGEIFYGEGDKEFIGQGLINKSLERAVKDDNVKAIVLRIDSPGGSALVSDIIWRQVEVSKKSKPVVVSFGNVAASGGYYIGVGGDKIFAEPTTITGSIGVFGTIPNINELADKVGINAEQVGTNQNSVDYSFFEPMTDGFRGVLREGIEDTYNTFLERVSAGRNMTVEEVDAVAQGRVWSGVEAQRLGLVDELGSLDDAIDAAAQMADLDYYGIRKYPRYKSGFEKFMEDFSNARAKIGSAIIEEEIGSEAYMILKDFKQFSEKKGIQAKMPFSLNIR
ncbi:signal peptide peptidase SppA [Flagellimonas meridianipacifica]|uniref:Protease-4 n=1 Tax=Flagellimonas meridianipacifica TaxID=1080225 RepID=A0A2T0MJL6_9FLAO|nr:signal peptide peptidase SppA [Allomuricauda pacifica]PRX57771.1 protease-4 [Allomuricauda pacifica]